MCAISIYPIYLHGGSLAQLCPTGSAMVTCRTAMVMMNHNSAMQLCDIIVHTAADGDDSTCWFMSCDDLRVIPFRLAIIMQIAATHSRGFNFNDYVIGAGYGVWKIYKGNRLIAWEHDSTHSTLSLSADLHLTGAQRETSYQL